MSRIYADWQTAKYSILLRLLVLSKYGEHPSSRPILAGVHHGKSVPWLAFFEREGYFFWICFSLFHSFLGNCERWIDDWYCSFWEQEGILEFFLFCFFCCGFLKIFNGRCCSFWRSKGIMNTLLLENWWFFILQKWRYFFWNWFFPFFLFCFSAVSWETMGSWKVDDWNYSFWERIDNLVCFFGLYIYFWNKLFMSSMNYCFKK